MDLLLSRHGNTFAPGMPIVWAGSTNDFPLVQKGVEQGENFAAVLKAQRIKVEAIYCSPLQRTLKYASIIVDKLNLPFRPIIDPRINEIDYGAWGGLTNDQVAASFGEKAIKDWDEKSLWPSHGQWAPSEAQVIYEVQSFVEELKQKYAPSATVLVISSNGRLRYFLKLVNNQFERRVKTKAFKVGTGNICKIKFIDQNVELAYWNIKPSVEIKL